MIMIQSWEIRKFRGLLIILIAFYMLLIRIYVRIVTKQPNWRLMIFFVLLKLKWRMRKFQMRLGRLVHHVMFFPARLENRNSQQIVEYIIVKKRMICFVKEESHQFIRKIKPVKKI